MRTLYDIVETVGSWGAKRSEMVENITRKLLAEVPLTDIETLWLAVEAKVVVCDCRSCVEKSTRDWRRWVNTPEYNAALKQAEDEQLIFVIPNDGSPPGVAAAISANTAYAVSFKDRGET